MPYSRLTAADLERHGLVLVCSASELAERSEQEHVLEADWENYRGGPVNPRIRCVLEPAGWGGDEPADRPDIKSVRRYDVQDHEKDVQRHEKFRLRTGVRYLPQPHLPRYRPLARSHLGRPNTTRRRRVTSRGSPARPSDESDLARSGGCFGVRVEAA